MRANDKRWHLGAHAYVVSTDVDAFLSEIFEVCRRHGFDICHEDVQGGFIIEKLTDGKVPESVMAATLGRTIPLNEVVGEVAATSPQPERTPWLR